MAAPNVQTAECFRDWAANLLGALDLGDAVALLAATAAWFAAWQAFRSAEVSRRNYALAAAAERRSEPAIEVYLVDSRLHHLRTEGKRTYVFNLVVTNRSVVPNSIKQVSLSLAFGKTAEPPSNITIPHEVVATGAVADNVHDALNIPASIAPGETLSGSAMFTLNDDLLQGAAVESYTLVVTDAHDRCVSCEVILLREANE